jgi:ribose transport system permease protein
MMNVNVYYEQTFLGLIILLAVSIESIRVIMSNSSRKRQLKKTDSEQEVSTSV